MNGPRHWSRILVMVGLAAMVFGALDPLEGSLVILPGVALVAFGAWRGHGRHRTLLLWAFALVAVGVGAMFGLSALGGFGGNSGRSNWWAVFLLPYAVGWIVGVVGAIRSLRDDSGPSILHGAP